MTNWKHSCHVRLGIRPEDYKPKFVVADVLAARNKGVESFDEDAGFRGIGFDIVPFNVALSMNNYAQADTVKIQIPMTALPCDPRALRQVQVQVFGGVLLAEEIKVRAALGGTGSVYRVGWDVEPQTGNSYELFRGFAQSYTVKAGKNDVVEISAVDLTSIFIAAEMPEKPLHGIPKTARIDEVMQLLIYGDGIPIKDASKRFGLPGARGTIIVNETGAPLPRLMDIHPPSAFDSKGSAKVSRSAGSGKKIKYWDLMTDLCKSAGLWCFIRAGRKPVLALDGRKVVPGAELVITNPRTFYAAADSQEAAQAGIRRFLLGYNIDDFELSKQFTGDDVPTTIEVRSYDPTIRKTRFARYPRKNLINRTSVNGKGDREEVQVRVVAPMSGPDVVNILSGMAISLFEDQARRECEFTISSASTMSALFEPPSYSDGIWNPELADMFWMRPGDPFEMGAVPAESKAFMAPTLSMLLEQSVQQRGEMYLKLGWPPPLAFQQANADRNPLVQKFARCVKLEWHWDYPDDGNGEEGSWSWQLHGRSYMDVRNAPQVLSDQCKTGIGRS